MTNEETPHAISTWTELKENVREASSDLRMILNVEQPTVNVPRDALTKLLNGVDALLKGQSAEEKRSLTSLYIGTFLGALIGVIGNFFVSFWFEPLTEWSIAGLVFSFLLLFLISAMLFRQAKKYAIK